MDPLVSVYIVTYNRYKCLINAITSVVNQTYQQIEIIVVDDGSKDNTPSVVSEMMRKYPNLIYFRNEKNKGANYARNKALELANGEFITGLDDDDIFMPNRIKYFISTWEDKYSFLCDNFINSTNTGKNPHYKKSSNMIISLNSMLFSNQASNQVFTKTERLRAINGFNESLKRLQDWDCWLRLINKYGSAIRYNNKSYIMNHHENVRVSNCSSYREAYINLAKENIRLFDNIGNDFAKKYIFLSTPKKWYDCFKCESAAEFKFILKEYLNIN